ncbi:unnamed protein product [Rhizoctonia solani]|uniref:NADP-dependent oxidoreductase domain-containing protein n=1 Tax=Rhizoctonia solani TaxID=456999 RepID=A0A8H3CKK3_9AGAM|nr:unnamed protein product [Rhizoctonia solani]
MAESSNMHMAEPNTRAPPCLETTTLGPFTVPRLWTGLWQLSSPAWGTAPSGKIKREMARHVSEGYTAFDMVKSRTSSSPQCLTLTLCPLLLSASLARVSSISRLPRSSRLILTPADHYGSAELLFGQYRQSLDDPSIVVGATKWCVFAPTTITRAVVEEGVRERNERMRSTRVDLLQFHWQNYDDKAYLDALDHLRDLQSEGVITAIGLCNFDSIRTDEICTHLGKGAIVSNQVQFSLIDVRPLHGMADVCERHSLKLLTYGSLCGGFLADKWLGAPEPDAYRETMTPSQRKLDGISYIFSTSYFIDGFAILIGKHGIRGYLDMIVSAWGTWSLFQSLLRVLRTIGDRHGGVSIANVATRWVLEHSFVGAVIIGARLGVSEHTRDNLQTFAFRLTEEDFVAIEGVLKDSKGHQLIQTIGDCGSEYR